MIIVCPIPKSNFNWEVKLLSSLSKSFAFLCQSLFVLKLLFFRKIENYDYYCLQSSTVTD